MTVMIMVKVKLLLMGTNLFLRYCHLIASMCFFMFFLFQDSNISVVAPATTPVCRQQMLF